MPQPAGSYRDHLAWLAGRDQGAAVAAWSQALAGLDGPTKVAAVRPEAAVRDGARFGRRRTPAGDAKRLQLR